MLKALLRHLFLLLNLVFCQPVQSLRLFEGRTPAGQVSVAAEAASPAAICAVISGTGSCGGVYSPGSTEYETLRERYVDAAKMPSACLVRPGSAKEVGNLLRLLSLSRTPFAIQGGGHSANTGFSATSGVHISMSAFNTVKYDAETETATIGTGLKWIDVYRALAPYERGVLGGRVSGVGVAGYLLGGGYSWMANQHGLAVDSITSFELVRPDGRVVTVTDASDPDLFFSLKGGYNNFGIVTQITIKTFHQGMVWGASIGWRDPNIFPDALAALSNFFSETVDPKMSFLAGITLGPDSSGDNIGLNVLYDGPKPPPGAFDGLLRVPTAGLRNETESFVAFAGRFAVPKTPRLAVHTVAVPEYSEGFLNFVLETTKRYRDELAQKSLARIHVSPEPFLPSILSHNASPTAYPFTREKTYSPFPIAIYWSDPKDDEIFKDAVKRLSQELEGYLVEEGHTDVRTAPLYPNYAFGDTPLERLYGSNLPRMRSVKARIDPHNVMELAGGFKI